MIEVFEINFYDSDYWLYGIGLIFFGGYDLIKWDIICNIIIYFFVVGIEEMVVFGFVFVFGGFEFFVVVGDNNGFIFKEVVDFLIFFQIFWMNFMWISVIDVGKWQRLFIQEFY